MRIFIFLAVLTAIEVAAAFLAIPKTIQGLFLISLAIAKATLVALYYMHLRFENQILRLIAIGPLLFVAILMLLPLLDLAGLR
jgi:cytochrome c oxidase subunit 4